MRKRRFWSYCLANALPKQAPFLNVENISASYDGAKSVLDGVSFSLQEGELGCLLGPSGCGKTTILRAISGFQDLLTGQISLHNRIISGPQLSLSPEQRNVGMVFQDHALFPHLNIAQNVAFGLHKLKPTERQKRTTDMLELVGMSERQNNYPHELSGGQSQRVALARAIAPQPKLLLMDEPFSNLDAELRESLGHEVRVLLKELGITAIMVTHDQHDAFALGDKIGVMSAGQLMQWGHPFDLYHGPTNRFVANFIGDGIFVPGHMAEADMVISSFGEIRGEPVGPSMVGREVDLLIRPDDVIYNPQSSMRGEVVRKAFKGAQTLYTLEMRGGGQLMSLVPSHDDYEIGDIIGVSIEADHLVCFEKASNN
jgi:iron(III) transport system ATP-binding protein